MANIITRNIPNSITCCNLISGCIAIAFAYEGKQEWALAFIIIGAVFDFFDGMVARLLHVSSPIGKELDSLADDITFGAAPAMMVFTFLHQLPYPDWLDGAREYLPYVAFLIAAFSALRLAKFNLDERQATSFIGLPTPANALFWGSLIVGGGTRLIHIPYALPVVLVLIACRRSPSSSRGMLSSPSTTMPGGADVFPFSFVRPCLSSSSSCSSFSSASLPW